MGQLKHKGFAGSVFLSNEDEVFVGKTKGINDLSAFEGSTREELEIDFLSVADNHLNDAGE
ncbi:MAG: hypothetical protein ACM3O8_10100 [Methylococcaceae bacterium]|nr:hypothetical protein [Prolixibacteraceae bacterium]